MLHGLTRCRPLRTAAAPAILAASSAATAQSARRPATSSGSPPKTPARLSLLRRAPTPAPPTWTTSPLRGAPATPRRLLRLGVLRPSRSSIITGMYPRPRHLPHAQSGRPAPASQVLPRVTPARPYALLHQRSKTDYNLGQPNQDSVPAPSAWDDCSNKRLWRRNRPARMPFFFSLVNLIVSRGENQARADAATLQYPRSTSSPIKSTTPPRPSCLPTIPTPPSSGRIGELLPHTVSIMDAMAGQLLRNNSKQTASPKTRSSSIGATTGRGLTGGKRWVYDSGIHALTIRWPGQIRPGTVSSPMVSLMDLGPPSSPSPASSRPNTCTAAVSATMEPPPQIYIFAAPRPHGAEPTTPSALSATPDDK